MQGISRGCIRHKGDGTQWLEHLLGSGKGVKSVTCWHKAAGSVCPRRSTERVFGSTKRDVTLQWKNAPALVQLAIVCKYETVRERERVRVCVCVCARVCACVRAELVRRLQASACFYVCTRLHACMCTCARLADLVLT